LFLFQIKREKPEMNYIIFYKSPLGNIMLASDGISLTGLWFEKQKYFAENRKFDS
jgi:methylated-DNA-[protein]-cysteine S-methyltransferase